MADHITIQDLPVSERPYEKYLSQGVQSLSDAELLAIIIKTGTKDYNSAELARRLLTGRQGNLLNLYDFSDEELMQIPGIGRVKAIQLKAVAELSQRIAATERKNQIQMDQPSTIAAYYMEQLRHQQTEFLVAAFFDAKCHFLGDQIISKGCVNSAYVSPRDIFRSALLKNAVLLIILHNHPSGDPSPSQDDMRVTRNISESGRMLGVQLVDHIIIGDNRYYSFKDNCLI